MNFRKKTRGKHATHMLDYHQLQGEIENSGQATACACGTATAPGLSPKDLDLNYREAAVC